MMQYCSGVFGSGIRRRRTNLDSEQHNLHSGNTSDPPDSLSKTRDEKGARATLSLSSYDFVNDL